jgi:hypothetical protein
MQLRDFRRISCVVAVLRSSLSVQEAVREKDAIEDRDTMAEPPVLT